MVNNIALKQTVKDDFVHTAETPLRNVSLLKLRMSFILKYE